MTRFVWQVALVLISAINPAVGQSQADLDEEYDQMRGQVLAGDWRAGPSLQARQATAPDGFGFTFAICESGNEACAYSQATLPVDLTFAYRGYYQAQRNIAYCLVTGCDGAIVANAPLGCAWRIVVLASGNPNVDVTDRANLDLCFETLDPIGYATMRSQARALYQTAYGRNIDPAWLSD